MAVQVPEGFEARMANVCKRLYTWTLEHPVIHKARIDIVEKNEIILFFGSKDETAIVSSHTLPNRKLYYDAIEFKPVPLSQLSDSYDSLIQPRLI
ncbi:MULTISPECIES: hypothetical protein [Iodobacter]|uniref:Uncharacterized protein n=2 Tax=Iodobacter TaxID=32014 RepID=A0A377Q476_9NEIS|nr:MULTISPECIES: hypothetical protein [Iodobacter]NHQ86819.1 hypothetical protein [Iodobacter violacea]TCU84558.1 hypothetical protein EV682_10983 [Iodobacter fluviatilis]STQ90024.1 Uncharacterised protein [Iodobacter fluviatilis]